MEVDSSPKKSPETATPDDGLEKALIDDAKLDKKKELSEKAKNHPSVTNPRKQEQNLSIPQVAQEHELSNEQELENELEMGW